MTSAAALPSRLIGLSRRIPASLSDLRGPAHGVVALPTGLPWVGFENFNVDDPGERLTAYRALMDCGQRVDLVQYINADLLRQDWPRIKRLTARGVIALWERQLPGLAVAC